MITDLMERVRALVFRRRIERELDEEMCFHIERDTAERIRAGVDPETARRQARAAFGGVDNYMEQTRDASGVRPIDDAFADTRFAFRALRRNPGFALTVVGVLGLAIGATATVATVVNRVLIAELPYPNADRLVRVFQQNSPTNTWTLSAVDILAIFEQQKSFDAIGGVQFSSAAYAGNGDAQVVAATRTTSGLFTAVSARPSVGRLIEPRDEERGAPPVAVVTFAFAEANLGGESAAVGKALMLDGVSHEVIGVLPRGKPDVAGMRPPIWRAYQIQTPTRRGPFGMRAIGRLKADVTLEQARADLAGISRRIYPLWSSGFKDSVAVLTPHSLRESIVGNADRSIWPFGVAVVLVLLVALANVTTLMLVRASARSHELAVRATLGASRTRLARLVITESLLLTMVAGAVGTAIAWFGVRSLGAIAPALPRAREIVFGLDTMAIALGLAVLCGAIVSLSPVVAVAAGKLASWRDDSRRSGGSPATSRARGLLVGAEFALALPLLVGAALLANSFLRLQRVNPGYETESTFSVSISLPPRYDSVSTPQFWQRATARALETPGVVAAGIADAAPPDNQGNTNNFTLVAKPLPPGSPEPASPWSGADPGFFEAMRIPLLDGRWFTPSDTGNPNPVVLVSKSWVDRYMPGESAVGQQVVMGGCYECPRTTIVGVVGDVKYQGLSGTGEGFYEPMAQMNTRSAFLFVRANGSPDAVMRQVIEGVRSLDATIPLGGATMRAQLRDALSDPGRWTAVLWSFAACALLLCAMGIFGLLSFIVRRQRREIGVRMALGAEPGEVRRMVVANGMRFVLPGAAVGLGLAFLAAPWLSSMLYGVTPTDPLTLTTVTAVLLGFAALASLVPAVRASKIRAIEAINSE
jgi:putative ABC transport system permease protein